MNFTGEPNAHLLCHCLDCRKISGGNYSNNVVVPEDSFKCEGTVQPPSIQYQNLAFQPLSLCYPTHLNIFQDQVSNKCAVLCCTGKPKEITKQADSSKKITSHFCSDCGTTLFRIGESFPGAIILKAGVLDDPKWANQNKPKGELYAPERVSWVAALDDVAQIDGMPS